MSHLVLVLKVTGCIVAIMIVTDLLRTLQDIRRYLQQIASKEKV